jgi:hypothetical protein
MPREQVAEAHKLDAAIEARCFARMDANAEATKSLAALRDALLPNLISGELRTQDAERCVAEGAYGRLA